MEKLKYGFVTPLRVEDVDDTNWALFDDLIFRGSKGDTFVCEKGMRTDFASTPTLVWIILPRIGKWTKAAVLHDKMCDRLNEWYAYLELKKKGFTLAFPPEKPAFTSIDADAIFRKNAREGGTDAIRSELLWMGVRLGALRNPARREDWLSTAPRVARDLVLVLAFLFAVIFIIVWIAHSL